MKTIGELAALVEGARVIGDPEQMVTGIQHDSRKAEKGTLFVCIPGAHVDGHDFIPQAIAASSSSISGTPFAISFLISLLTDKISYIPKRPS